MTNAKQRVSRLRYEINLLLQCTQSNVPVEEIILNKIEEGLKMDFKNVMVEGKNLGRQSPTLLASRSAPA